MEFWLPSLYFFSDLKNLVDERKVTLTQSQGKIFDRIMEAVQTGDVAYIFIDARGGTGKTFLLNTILSYVRQSGDIALATASSGIAATLLKLGRTAHSRFRLPIPPTGVYSSYMPFLNTCNIFKVILFICMHILSV